MLERPNGEVPTVTVAPLTLEPVASTASAELFTCSPRVSAPPSGRPMVNERLPVAPGRRVVLRAGAGHRTEIVLPRFEAI